MKKLKNYALLLLNNPSALIPSVQLLHKVNPLYYPYKHNVYRLLLFSMPGKTDEMQAPPVF